MASAEKQEDATAETSQKFPMKASLIELSSSDSDSYGEGGGSSRRKKARLCPSSLPLGFLDPLTPEDALSPMPELSIVPLPPAPLQVATKVSKQFWKAGDYDDSPSVVDSLRSTGIDHVRVHPKFLHSNATSHKWALGAIAELLDNSLDEVSNGATYVNIDMLKNKKDQSRMLLVEDNGGGMDPDKMRQCMSLGYSVKSKMSNTIGQYGNGFKTSTMRIGADVLVFSRSHGKEGRRPTQSIGLLSYTFLRSTGKEDIIVPMIDYENQQGWKMLERTNANDWNVNLQTILEWSPYTSEADLLQQFDSMKDQGTRIVIYNLWEDDQGELELDFDTDEHDIQIRGVNRDEKNIKMAEQFPNSRHFLTYRHSLRSYASILYLRLPHVFRMILRSKEIQHHNIINDMMLRQEVTYKPQSAQGFLKDPNMVAVVTIGFVKDAKHHIDVQGFNVYHKNRLIKPFWRVWTAAGSGGRGVIGVLEANFIEPAHDKQDFERTTILSRLESRLVQMQKAYWSTNSHKVGYARGSGKKSTGLEIREGSREDSRRLSLDQWRKDDNPSTTYSTEKSKETYSGSGRLTSRVNKAQYAERLLLNAVSSRTKGREASEEGDGGDPDYVSTLTPPSRRSNFPISKMPMKQISSKSVAHLTSFSMGGSRGIDKMNASTEESKLGTRSLWKDNPTASNIAEAANDDSESMAKTLKEENMELKERLSRMDTLSRELQLERDRNKELTEQLEEARRKLEKADKEQDAMLDLFDEEKSRRDKEAETLQIKLKDAYDRIQELLDKSK